LCGAILAPSCEKKKKQNKNKKNNKKNNKKKTKKKQNNADNKKLHVYKLLHSCSPENVLLGGPITRAFGKCVNDSG
jgi:hypothetical protein